METTQTKPLPWYLTAAVVSGALLLHHLWSGQLNLPRGDAFKIGIVFMCNFSFIAGPMAAVAALAAWPFWATVKHYTQPTKAPYGLFLIFTTLLLIGFDVFVSKLQSSAL